MYEWHLFFKSYNTLNKCLFQQTAAVIVYVYTKEEKGGARFSTVLGLLRFYRTLFYKHGYLKKTLLIRLRKGRSRKRCLRGFKKYIRIQGDRFLMHFT